MGRLSAGAGHTCAVERGGGVACWGSNPDGQLGDGSELDAPLPKRLDGLAASGRGGGELPHLRARERGAVFCWGWNVGGQVGDG